METHEGNVVLRSGRQLGAAGNRPPSTSGFGTNTSHTANVNEITTPIQPNVNTNAKYKST